MTIARITQVRLSAVGACALAPAAVAQAMDIEEVEILATHSRIDGVPRTSPYSFEANDQGQNIAAVSVKSPNGATLALARQESKRPGHGGNHVSAPLFKLLSTLVASTLLAVTGFSDPGAQGTPDYFPLQVGNQWIYYPSYSVLGGDEGYRVDTIIGSETIGDIATRIWKREEAAGDNYHEKRWLAKDGSNVVLHKFWSSGVGDPETLFTPPLTFEKLNPPVGDSWVVQGNLGSLQFKVTFHVESITDSVTVPAGTFNNCIRISEVNELTQGGLTQYEYEKHWLAPNVGPVRYADYNSTWAIQFSQDLVSFSNVGLLHADINVNQEAYVPNDTLRAYLSLYNSSFCQDVDIYVAIQLAGGTFLYYPDFATSVHSAIPFPVNVCGSPFVSDYLLIEYPIPSVLPKGTYRWYCLLTPPGNFATWLSLDEAPFNVQ